MSKIDITINNKPFTVHPAAQTGRSLKELANIPLTDVLFHEKPHEDVVVPNDTTIHVKGGEKFRSAPPANYGDLAADQRALAAGHTGAVDEHLQPDGWKFLILRAFALPAPYAPQSVDVLIKLPPTFPDAAPDMFWVEPHVRVNNRATPTGTTTEVMLNRNWQRFSWHLQSGSWIPGRSELRDFVRCVRARFLTGQ